MASKQDLVNKVAGATDLTKKTQQALLMQPLKRLKSS